MAPERETIRVNERIRVREVRVIGSDAEQLGVSEGDSVRISSAGGSVLVPAEIREALPAGLVFFPEHFSDPPVKDLIPAEVDPVTGVIYHKSGSVLIEKDGNVKGGRA